MANFLFKYPSRGRPKIFMSIMDKYINMLSNKHSYEFIISMDNNDRTMNCARIKGFLEKKPNTKYYIGNNRNKIQAINADVKKATTNWDILVLMSDDMIPQVQGYDDIIAENMAKYFPSFDGCLHFNDGKAGQSLNTLSIMGRRIYDYFGYIYHPSYISLWCDNEYTEVTRALNKAVYIDQIIIKHEWTKYTGKDYIHVKNESFFKRDKKIYEGRKAAGFPK